MLDRLDELLERFIASVGSGGVLRLLLILWGLFVLVWGIFFAYLDIESFSIALFSFALAHLVGQKGE